MRLMSLNIELSKHLDRVTDFIRRHQPDVICLQELVRKDLPRLAADTGVANCHFVPMGKHPDHQNSPLFGVGILSRFAFDSTSAVTYAGGGSGADVLDLSAPERRVVTCRYSIARATIKIGKATFEIGTTHFPWTPNANPTSFQYSAVQVMTDVLADKPILLTGDFNAPRGGPIFATLQRRWTDWIPSNVTTSIDPKLHRAGALELMVDGVFSSTDYLASNVRFHTGVSDHQAITADVALAASSV